MPATLHTEWVQNRRSRKNIESCESRKSTIATKKDVEKVHDLEDTSLLYEVVCDIMSTKPTDRPDQTRQKISCKWANLESIAIMCRHQNVNKLKVSYIFFSNINCNVTTTGMQTYIFLGHIYYVPWNFRSPYLVPNSLRVSRIWIYKTVDMTSK